MIAHEVEPHCRMRGIQHRKATYLIGTPCYVSPEQSHGQRLDGTTDTFSLVQCCTEMMAGLPIFPGAIHGGGVCSPA
jgi:serine/threonine protein kinase